MITDSISAPTGAGMTKFIQNRIEVEHEKVLVIAGAPELAKQWQRSIPDVRAITWAYWRAGGVDATRYSLIIVDVTANQMRLIRASMEATAAHVWLINNPLMPAPAYRPNPDYTEDQLLQLGASQLTPARAQAIMAARARRAEGGAQ